MSACRDAALEYAAQGWPVVALYTNTDAGCTCGNHRCKSPGKHPRPDLCPNGVNDATTDFSIIAEWPDDINVGIALGHHNLMSFDVDVSSIAASLLDPRAGITDQTGMVVTGRPGCHIYFLCSGDVNTVHVKSKDDERIGEIRGLGSYVVAPPSMSASGRPYKWAGMASGRWSPRLSTTANASSYVAEMLRSIGVDVSEASQSAPTDTEFPDGIEIVPIQLPDQLDKHPSLLNVKQILKGGVGAAPTSEDRSRHLFNLAKTVAHAAKETEVSLSRVALAGIVKRADIAYYDKYAGDVREGRRSQQAADSQYYIIACKVLPDGDLMSGPSSGEPQADPSENSTAPQSSHRTTKKAFYKWDEDDGVLYHVQQMRNSEKFTEVANFKPELIAEVTIDRGDKDPKVLWKARLTLADGRTTLVKLEVDDREGTTAVERAISKKCSSDFLVFPYSYVHIKPALYQFRDGLERYTNRGVTGWFEVGNERFYLLPAAAGAIGKDGVDPHYRMNPEDLPDNEPIGDPMFERYGQGVRPPAQREVESAWGAFAALITCGKVDITFPIALQILAGPLYSAGVSHVPPLMHVFGRTGVLKTSYCLAALSMFGMFDKATAPPLSWSATANSIQALLHFSKDITVLVDDYKSSHQKEGGELTRLINNYADKSARRRLSPRGVPQKTISPRGLILSNGEDRWEKEASIVARTIIVPMYEGDIDEDLLDDVQRIVQEGELQLFGGAFISWLAAQDDLFETLAFENDRGKLHRKMLKRYRGEEMHRRLLASLSSLVAVGNILLRFVSEVFPEHVETVKQWIRQMTSFFLMGIKERAEEVKALSPSRQVLSFIAGAMAAGTAILRPALGIDEAHHYYPDNYGPRSEVIGWWSERKDKKYVHLNRDVTFGWYQERASRRRESIPFSWQAFLQEVKAAYGASHKGKWLVIDKDGTKSSINVITIPMEVVEKAADDV